MVERGCQLLGQGMGVTLFWPRLKDLRVPDSRIRFGEADKSQAAAELEQLPHAGTIAAAP